jgi:hypothetical protein
MERYIPTKKQNKQRKNAGIKPGTYEAVVTSVVSPAGFVAGQAVDVTYAVRMGELTVSYTERYLIADRYSPRTQEFEALLDSIGAERYEDLVGVEFELTFAYEVKKSKSWCNIVDRSLLIEVDNDDSDC